MENLEIIIKESELSETDQKMLRGGFDTYEAIAQEWSKKAKAIVVTDASQVDLMKQAKEGRKLLKEKRIEIERNRKAMKEQSLRKSQAIDAVARYLTSLITPIEDYLESQEKFAEIQEAKRLAELEASRVTELAKYVDNVEVYNLKVMDDNTYKAVLENAKKSYEIKQAELKKAEDERIAQEKKDAEEREKMRVENERLKKEAAEREAKLEKEREAQRKKEAAEKAAHEAELAKERAAKAKLEAEIQAKKDEEEKARKAAEAKAKAAKAAPDIDKLRVLAADFLAINFPEMQTEEGKIIVNGARELAKKVNIYIIKNIENI